jgi:DNA-binding NarL/FixJ family response regulator
MTCVLLECLSDREREVAALVAEGLTNKVIAAQLGISLKTVYNHVAAIAEALNATNGDTRVLIARRVLLCAA